MVRYGMVVDLKRCIACDTCTVACRAQKATPRGVHFKRLSKFEVGEYPYSKLGSLPLFCMHCKEPPCRDVCPTGATTKRSDGIVVVDRDKCMGCRYCAIVCPYGSRVFVKELRNYYEGYTTPYEEVGFKKHKRGTSEKCDFCLERVEQGLQPACVAACVGNALHFGDLDDPDSEVSRLKKIKRGFQLNPELGTEPSVYYLPGD